MPSDPTPPITPEELQEMKRRCEKATPGRWFWWLSTADYPERLHGGDEGATIMRPLHRTHDSADDGFLSFDNEHDQDFIAHARTDLPRCIAEIERLRAAGQALISEAERMNDQLEWEFCGSSSKEHPAFIEARQAFSA
jgi:hypothetical protein